MALTALVLLSVGCSVRIAPSEPPVPSARAGATNSPPTSPPTPDVVPGPTVAWQTADQGALGGELAAMLDIAPTRDGLVALGVLREPQNGIERRLLGSADGITWRFLDGPPDAVNVRSIEAVDGVVWAFGRPPFESLETSVWTTNDGEAWSEIEGVSGLDLGRGGALDLVAADGGMLMLAHRAPTTEVVEFVVLRTHDGATWAEVPPVRAPSWRLRTLAGDQRGYVAMYTNGDTGETAVDEAWYSPDGDQWTAHSVPGAGTGLDFVDAAAAHGQFVVGGLTSVGEDQTPVPAVWSSDDGRTWALAHLEPGVTGSVDVVVPTTDGFVGLGWLSGPDLERTRSWWSPDGASWVAAGDLPPFGYAMAGVEWQERLIAVGGVNEDDGSVSPAIWVGEPAR